MTVERHLCCRYRPRVCGWYRQGRQRCRRRRLAVGRLAKVAVLVVLDGLLPLARIERRCAAAVVIIGVRMVLLSIALIQMLGVGVRVTKIDRGVRLDRQGAWAPRVLGRWIDFRGNAQLQLEPIATGILGRNRCYDLDIIASFRRDQTVL